MRCTRASASASTCTLRSRSRRSHVTAAGQIIGAHLIGHHAEDLIHLFALAMRHGIPSEQLENSLFAFPTFSANVKDLL
jgi:pyruvate/2-oxoglutarate dehydrogenase complex dihydrolipoamide dehydrogenase (E3) component